METYKANYPPRFFMFFLLINNTHYNLLIYNTKKRTLERFDPHAILPGENDIDLELIKYFEPRIQEGNRRIKLKYFKPVQFSFMNGYYEDMKEQYRYLTLEETYDADGNKVGPLVSETYIKWYDEKFDLCPIWCIWYADLRMSNPKLSQEKIDNYATDSIIEKGTGNNFQTFIFKYKYFIENVNEFFNRNPQYRNIDNDTINSQENINRNYSDKYMNSLLYKQEDIVEQVLRMFKTPEERRREEEMKKQDLERRKKKMEEEEQFCRRVWGAEVFLSFFSFF